jgi:hypothetical protein
MADGADLPQWLVFDAHNHCFLGSPHSELEIEVIVEVVATDYDGATVSQCFTLQTQR